MYEDLTDQVESAMKDGSKKLQHLEDQPQSERDLVSFVHSETVQRREAANRITQEGNSITNVAYLKGFTNVHYDTSSQQFRPRSNYANRGYRGPLVEFNYILPNIQNRLARLTKSPPRYNVKPNSTSDEDREAARLAIYIINQIWDIQKINKKRLSLLMWVQQCGHAYLKTCWDPTLGPKIPFVDDDGREKVMSLGDVRVDVASMFEVFPDQLAQDMEDNNSLIHAKIRPLSYFRTHYPERGHLVRPEGVWLQSLEYQQRINSFNANSEGGYGSANMIKSAAIELMYYEKPTYKNPFGRHVICANGVLLKDDELPIDEIPFSKFDDTIIGGSYYSEPIITHLRSPQDQYNRTLVQRARWVNRLLAGKFLAAKGHGLKKHAMNDQSGEVVEYNPVPNASEPKFMQTSSIPQYAYMEDDYLKGIMNEVSGVAEISKGDVPSAGMPAVGMQFLQEQDDTRIGVITESNEYSYADTGRQILKYVEKYYDYPRTLKIAGSGMEYAVKSLKGEDLRGNHDVVVVRGSTLPGSKVLRRQEIINLHQSGYLGDPVDPLVRQEVLERLEFGNVGDVWKDYSLDKQQIQKFIEMIESGEKPPVSEFDNHPLIIKELNRYRKSDKFQALDDFRKQVLFQTMYEHLELQTDMMAPETVGSEDANPNLQESDAAQAEELAEFEKLGAELSDEALQENMPASEIEVNEGEVEI